MARTRADLTKGPILKSLVIFALPILISNIFQQLYNTADTLIVGNTLGEEALAAVGACSVVYELLVGFALGLGVGMSIVVARCFGSGNEERLKRAVAGTLVIGFVTALILGFGSKLVLKPLLRLLDTPEDVLAMGYPYISVIIQCAAVTFAYNLCAGLLRAIGNSFMPLVFLIISSGLNIVLDLLFIIRFHMGVAGAAYATVIAQGVSAVLCVIYILRKARLLIPQKRHFAPDAALYRELAAQGLSTAFMNALVFASSLVMQRAINQLGMLTIAGHTVTRKINSFGIMPCGTVSSAVSTFVSQNRGAGNRERIRKGIVSGCIVVCVWAAIATALQALFAPALVRLISGSEEELVLSNAVRYLQFNAPFYSVLGVLFITRHSLQSLGRKVVPIASSCLELTIKVVFAALLIPRLGYNGVIICEPLIWCGMTALLATALVRHPYLRGKD